jgi:NAD(P)-dependent dehydrogenase (short-subunit alcohol dehydrogenase family)
MGKFDGKVVVVTGGGRSIGRAIAAAFGREGAQTVLAASPAKNLVAAVKVIAEGAPSAPEPVTIAADLRELAGCDILVNSAGATRAFERTRQEWSSSYSHLGDDPKRQYQNRDRSNPGAQHPRHHKLGLAPQEK